MAKKRTNSDWFDDDGNPLEDELDTPVGAGNANSYPGKDGRKDEGLVTDGGMNIGAGRSKDPDSLASTFGYDTADELISDLEDYAEDGRANLEAFVNKETDRRYGIHMDGTLTRIGELKGRDLGISLDGNPYVNLD